MSAEPHLAQQSREQGALPTPDAPADPQQGALGEEPRRWRVTTNTMSDNSQLQLVGYHQCCILTG